jgi:DNA-binding transcriptional LysR family regulator
MEVRQLQISCTLAEELNFTRTAERVHTVQSNVTTQIKALEDELGTPLFDRLGRRVTLTDAGRRFQPFALQALTAMEQGQRAMQAGSEPSGPLRIGAPESVLTYRLPQVLRASGKFDMAILMSDDKPHPALKSVRLRTERVFLLSDPGHPLTKLRTVKPADLAGQLLLLTEAGCSYREKFDQALALQNIRPGNITEFSSVEAIKQCVIAGMGLALLPAIVVAREVRQHQIKALHWAGPSLDIATQVLWHKDKWVSPAMAAFLEIMQEKLEDLEETGPLLAIEGSLTR